MDHYQSRWRIHFSLDPDLELRGASLYLHDDVGSRELIHMVTGPFDTPDQILRTLLEMIEHAEWRGQQLRLPVPPSE